MDPSAACVKAAETIGRRQLSPLESRRTKQHTWPDDEKNKCYYYHLEGRAGEARAMLAAQLPTRRGAGARRVLSKLPSVRQPGPRSLHTRLAPVGAHFRSGWLKSWQLNWLKSDGNQSERAKLSISVSIVGLASGSEHELARVGACALCACVRL